MTNHFNQLTPAQAERLAMLAEECGEVLQVIGKILRHGYDSYHPDQLDVTNRQLLGMELTDLYAVAASLCRDKVPEGTLYDQDMAWEKKLRYAHHQEELASMCAPQGDIDMDLLGVLDSHMFPRVKDVKRDPYAEGLNRVATTPAPKGQKFPVGARVWIGKNLGDYMSHFTSGVGATVLYTYAHAYGGDNVTSYALDVDGEGYCAWYKEHQLTLTQDAAK